MCGIVGAVAGRNVTGILLEGLRRLEYRGYDSAGVAVIKNDECRIDRRRTLGKVGDLVDNVRLDPVRGTTGIAHTRWATHGAPDASRADLLLEIARLDEQFESEQAPSPASRNRYQRRRRRLLDRVRATSEDR